MNDSANNSQPKAVPKVLQEIFVPKETVNDEHVTVAKIYFSTGDNVNEGDVVIDLETSKTIISIEAEYSGFIEYFCKENDEIEIGKLIGKIYDIFSCKENAEKHSNTDSDNYDEKIEPLFSNAALNYLNKNKIDKSLFIGRDFVSLDDVKEITGIKKDEKISEREDKPPVNNKKNNLQNVEIIPLPKSKQSEIIYLSDIQKAGLNSVVNIFADVSHIFDLLNENLEIFKDSLLPVVVYEVSRLLKKYRELNAYFTDNSVAYYKDIHIGLAVDIDDGLKVLKISNTDKKDLRRLEIEIFDIINKYLDKHLTPDDISGTTFTITDLSSENISFFTPLINKSQSAILGISGIDKQLQRCVFTLTFDHRVTEGKRASQFLHELKERIESYRKNPKDLRGFQNPVGLLNPAEKYNQIKCYQCLKTIDEDKEMEGPGFIRIINHKMEEVYICHVCFKGM